MKLKKGQKVKITLPLICAGLMLACNLSNEPKESGDIIFGDDFSDSNNNWKIWNKPDESAVSFLDDGLIIIVYKPYLDVITTIDGNHEDVSIHTSVKKRFGSNDNVYGVVCRYLNADNYYGFLISSDGYYGIVKVVNGVYSLLSSEFMEYDENINQDETENWLHAVCEDSTLSIIINNKEKKKVVDSDLKKGKVGLIAGSFSDAGETAIFFDNFLVTVP
jgi:hypothetical protein